MKRHPKPGYLGPAFHEYLEYLEAVEAFFITGKTKVGRSVQLNNRLWEAPTDDAQFRKLIMDMMQVDSGLATVVRSSVKYRITVDTLVEIGNQYSNELIHVGHTIPMRLPHEACTIVVEALGPDDIIIVA